MTSRIAIPRIPSSSRMREASGVSALPLAPSTVTSGPHSSTTRRLHGINRELCDVACLVVDSPLGAELGTSRQQIVGSNRHLVPSPVDELSPGDYFVRANPPKRLRRHGAKHGVVSG